MIAASATAATTTAAGDVALAASQASSHFNLEPISAAVLRRRETRRRDALRRRGPVSVGCRDVDDYVLMGGFERGSVVGISAEGEMMGLLIALQALAGELCSSCSSGRGEGKGFLSSSSSSSSSSSRGRSRAMIITAQPPAAVLPALRDAVKAELAARGCAPAASEARERLLRSCLERVSVSRVFDLDGVWEVLGDLDIPPESPADEASPVPWEQQQREQEQVYQEGVLEFQATTSRNESGPEHMESIVLPELKPTRMEIADSDEEGEEFEFSPPRLPEAALRPPSSSPSSELSPPPSSMASILATPEPVVEAPRSRSRSRSKSTSPEEGQQEAEPTGAEPTQEEPAALPDIIIITHFSTLMTALFTRHDRTSAHDALQYLSAHLRYLSRNLPSSPLILLLNSTSSSGKSSAAANSDISKTELQQQPSADVGNVVRNNRRLEPTLRSIFNPAPLDIPGYVSQEASRRNKPAFGLVFSQLLDLHLLCTKVPRGDNDIHSDDDDGDTDGRGARYAWVVEVLLDEIGVWSSERDPGGGRKLREQRWTAVDLRGGRIVGSFEEVMVPASPRDVRVVGGFGGPRV